MSNIQYYTPRILLSVVAAFTAIVPYIADFNETHVYNPKWPGRKHQQALSSIDCSGLTEILQAMPNSTTARQ